MNLQQAMSESLGAASSSMQQAEAELNALPGAQRKKEPPLILQTKQAQAVSMDLLLKQAISQLDSLLQVTDVIAQQPNKSQENSNGTP